MSTKTRGFSATQPDAKLAYLSATLALLPPIFAECVAQNTKRNKLFTVDTRFPWIEHNLIYASDGAIIVRATLRSLGLGDKKAKFMHGVVDDATITTGRDIFKAIAGFSESPLKLPSDRTLRVSQRAAPKINDSVFADDAAIRLSPTVVIGLGYVNMLKRYPEIRVFPPLGNDNAIRFVGDGFEGRLVGVNDNAKKR